MSLIPVWSFDNSGSSVPRRVEPVKRGRLRLELIAEHDDEIAQLVSIVGALRQALPRLCLAAMPLATTL